MNASTPVEPRRPTAGIDWASDDQAVAVVDPDGVTIKRCMTVRARKDPIAARVAMANQLRAHLQSTLPGAIGLFRDIDSPITLAFLTRFPSQARADWLSPARLQTWLRSAGYYNPTNAAALHAHLTAAPRGTTGPEAAARAAVTLALVTALSAIRTQIKALEDQITAQLAAHPDGPIFTSLPGAGTVRAARLLAEIGDARGRYPTPESLVCLAGAAPSTRQSGKVKVMPEVCRPVPGRQPCAVTLPVMDLDEARLHVRTHSHAVLANARRDGTPRCHPSSSRSTPKGVQLEGTIEVLSLPEAMQPLVDYYRAVAGEHEDWDDYWRAMQAEQRCLLRITLLGAGPDLAG